MKTKYPQYAIGQWIDTSEEAMNQPQATILYGVQIKPEKGAKWMHCCRGSEPLIYKTPESTAAFERMVASAARHWRGQTGRRMLSNHETQTKPATGAAKQGEEC